MNYNNKFSISKQLLLSVILS